MQFCDKMSQYYGVCFLYEEFQYQIPELVFFYILIQIIWVYFALVFIYGLFGYKKTSQCVAVILPFQSKCQAYILCEIKLTRNLKKYNSDIIFWESTFALSGEREVSTTHSNLEICVEAVGERYRYRGHLMYCRMSGHGHARKLFILHRLFGGDITVWISRLCTQLWLQILPNFYPSRIYI